MDDENPLNVQVEEVLGRVISPECWKIQGEMDRGPVHFKTMVCPHGDDGCTPEAAPFGETSHDGMALTFGLLIRFEIDLRRIGAETPREGLAEWRTVPHWRATAAHPRLAGCHISTHSTEACEAVARCVVELKAAGKLSATRGAETDDRWPQPAYPDGIDGPFPGPGR